MSAMLASGSRARQSSAASRIAAILRLASARRSRPGAPPVDCAPLLPATGGIPSPLNLNMDVRVMLTWQLEYRCSGYQGARRRAASARLQGAVMATSESLAATGLAGRASRPPRRWLALVLLCLAQFMLILDVTVVNVALPDIGSSLHLDRPELTWVLTAYTLAFGGLMLLGGRLADLLGARRVVLAGLALFTAASLLSGLALNAAMLLGGRVAQGVGAALLSPSALSLVTTTFTGSERNKALGIWATIGGDGSAVGVILGGVLTSGPGWPWVFFINVPVGLLVLAALPALVPAGQPHGDRVRVDVPGALAVTAATGA